MLDRRAKVETEVMSEIMERRRSGIKQMANLFNDIHQIGKEFNAELDNQG